MTAVMRPAEARRQASTMIIGTKLGESEVKSFADGEASVSLYETVRGSDVFLVQSTCKPVNDSLMEPTSGETTTMSSQVEPNFLA